MARHPSEGWGPKYGAQLGLTVVEEIVLIKRGVLPARPFQLPEVAEVLGITKQGVSATEQKALDKLSRSRLATQNS